MTILMGADLPAATLEAVAFGCSMESLRRAASISSALPPGAVRAAALIGCR
jgi:hypothetical protein